MTSHAPRAASSPLPRRNFRGSFIAYAHGLLVTEFILVNQDRKEFDRLRSGGTREAKFTSKDHLASLEASGTGHRIVLDGEEVLPVDKGLSGNEAQVSLFCNLEIVSHPSGKKAVALSGGLVARSYRGSSMLKTRARFRSRYSSFGTSLRTGVARTARGEE